MGPKVTAGICSLILWLGCAAVSQAAETNSMRTLFKGGFSGLQEEKQMVITNRADWEKFWNRHSGKVVPKEPAPQVDFEKESVIVAAQGRQKSGGYSIEIADIKRGEDKTVIFVKTKSPKPGGLTIQAVTAPIHIVAVPRVQGKVEFKGE